MPSPMNGSKMKRLCVVLIGLSLCATSCAGEQPVPGSESPASVVTTEARAVGGDVAYAASELSRELAGDARFASVEVLKGKDVVVHWEGPVDSKLRDLITRFPEVPITVETARCSPGKLREYGSHLLATDPTVNIFSVSPDGSALQLTIDESVQGSPDVASLERGYSEAAGCPVTVQFGGVTPAS
jgi:hypothetical protein